MLILLLQKAQESTALKCHLVPMISDDEGEEEVIEYKCQVGDRMLEIENELEEFTNFLGGPHDGVTADFDLDFHKASIVDHKFRIPSDAKIAYDRIKDGGSGGADGNPTRRLGRRLGGKDPVGDQRVLVLYVRDGAGATPSFVKDGVAGSIEDNIFGTYGDPVYPGERVSASNDAHSFNLWMIVIGLKSRMY